MHTVIYITKNLQFKHSIIAKKLVKRQFSVNIQKIIKHVQDI